MANGVSPGGPGWWTRRWAAPITLAAAVTAAVAGVGLTVDRDAADKDKERQSALPGPRFRITSGWDGATPAQDAGTPWLQIHAMAKGGTEPVDSVRPPSPSAGPVTGIVDGPGRTFVVSSVRAEPCETRLFRFRVTADGHAAGIAPVAGGVVPSLVAGLALSPDGRSIAYATAPCTAGLRAGDTRRATLTVLDAAGRSRTWSTARPSVVGEIVWARDGRTLGYTTAEVRGKLRSGRAIGEAEVHALDTRAPGTDLLGGRVLFRSPPGAGRLFRAVMNTDGRTGYGELRKERPPATVRFTFAEGQAMRITHTEPEEPTAVEPTTIKPLTVTLHSGGPVDGVPLRACLNGIDAFGRVTEGIFMSNPLGTFECRTAWTG
ncbi:hypothetical protein [Actinomadura rubrisoli]|uniref:Uncharacterized protein n=1 Tax=Actinomadura rubrisoli TaxID=2530368 RepID=A0A4R5BR53_9ACTN|nr:hypothetical protein [Actinomadura rubrisoli]TDD86562.1 hypothetical protein E1298_17245 [Actinomadura rubrisoli]